MSARRAQKGFFYSGTPPIDPEWDDDGGAMLARCANEIDRYGIITVHPDGYDAAPLQTPLVSHPGDDDVRFVPVLPQLRSNPKDMEATPGHWFARRCERDWRKDHPPEDPPPPPRPPAPKLSDAPVYRPTALWGTPQPLPKPFVIFSWPPPSEFNK